MVRHLHLTRYQTRGQIACGQIESPWINLTLAVKADPCLVKLVCVVVTLVPLDAVIARRSGFGRGTTDLLLMGGREQKYGMGRILYSVHERSNCYF